MAQQQGPVTVVVTAAGNERSCDSWEDAVAVLSNGGRVKDGYPQAPPMEVPDRSEEAPAPAAPETPPAPADQAPAESSPAVERGTGTTSTTRAARSS